MSVVSVVCFALLGVGAVLILARLARGPSLLDRVVATDALLVTIACGIAVYCAVYRDISLEPVLLVVALLAFVGSVSVARYIGGMTVRADGDPEADADLAGRSTPGGGDAGRPAQGDAGAGRAASGAGDAGPEDPR